MARLGHLLAIAVLAALAMPAHAFAGGAVADPLLRRSRVPCPALCAARGCDGGPAADPAGSALPALSRLPRAAALRTAATAAVAVAAALASASPAFAGTVMVGGAAVDAEEETEDEAYEALDDSPGPLDVLLAKVNFKKLGVAGGAVLLADIVSGLVMGRSFLKIVSGNADPSKKNCLHRVALHAKLCRGEHAPHVFRDMHESRGTKRASPLVVSMCCRLYR